MNDWDLGTALAVFMFFCFVFALLGWISDTLDKD